MDNSRTFTGLIREIVRSSVKYIRHYIGEVADNEDTLNLGRVLIIIQELGWDTKDKGSWAFPRDKHSMSVPKIGDWVEMYFINGDPNLPVYMGIANEIKDMVPENYTGNVKEHILFESPGNVQKIVNQSGKPIRLFANYLIEVVSCLTVFYFSVQQHFHVCLDASQRSTKLV